MTGEAPPLASELQFFDAWVNMTPKGGAGGPFDVTYLFAGLKQRYDEGRTADDIVTEMTEAGVGQAILCAGYSKTHDDLRWTLDSMHKHPDRFLGSLCVDPRRGMDAVRELERRVRDDGFKLARILAFDTLVSYTDPRCFPLYAKCVELDIPIGVNVGVPGPLQPAVGFQDPIHLDEICAAFPELKVIMSHGGDPWAEVCVKLLQKWENLYYMTSAFAPKHIPEPIVRYMNARGADKIMWASDYPLLTFDRCVAEIDKMTFRDDEVRRKFCRDNARRVILGER